MTLAEAEREFLIRKLGSKKPLNEARRAFYKANGGSGTFLGELEVSWLKSAIGAALGTPQGNHVGDLWKQLLAASGLPVTNFLDQNKMTYFINTA